MRTLIFGYGNYDRQDDGAAWHVISLLRKALSIPDHETIDDDFISDDDLIFVFQLQLTPELAESVAQFDRVCFIDAHTGAVPEDVHYEVLHPSYQHSPLTHHLTPSSLLSIIQTIYHNVPESVLVSIRGYSFEFTQSLSTQTQMLVPLAVNKIVEWLDKENKK